MYIVQGEALEGLGVCQRHIRGGSSEAGGRSGGSCVEEESFLGIVPDAAAAA